MKKYYFKEIDKLGRVRANLRALKEVTDVYSYEEIFPERGRVQDRVEQISILISVSMFLNIFFFYLNFPMMFCVASCVTSMITIITMVSIRRKIVSKHAKQVLFPEATDPENGEWIPIRFVTKISRFHNVELEITEFSLNVPELINLYNEIFDGDLYLDSASPSFSW